MLELTTINTTELTNKKLETMCESALIELQSYLEKRVLKK